MKFLEEKSVQYFYVFHVVFPKQDKNFANHEVDDDFNSIEFKNSSESKKKIAKRAKRQARRQYQPHLKPRKDQY